MPCVVNRAGECLRTLLDAVAGRYLKQCVSYCERLLLGALYTRLKVWESIAPCHVDGDLHCWGV